MPSHYGKKAPTKHKILVNPEDPKNSPRGYHTGTPEGDPPHTHGKPPSYEIIPAKKAMKKEVRENIKPPTEYAPFKMKHAGSNPMKANFPSAFKQMEEVPVVPMKNPVSPIQKHMHTDNLPDGRSKSAPFQSNKFIGAKVAAEEAGKKSFVVDGKTFPLKQLSEEAVTEDVKMQMKSIEKQLKIPMLTEAKRKELKDKLLELSTTIKGQRYTDTGE